MSLAILLLLAFVPLEKGTIPFIPKDMAVTEGHIYLLGERGLEIYELLGDSLQVIYSSESPLRAIDADPIFLYLLDREGLKVITRGAEGAGVLKGGRFRDVTVSGLGIVYLLRWEGDRLYVLDIGEEEFTLSSPAQRLECSPAGFLGLGREKEIDITDSRGIPLEKFTGDYRDFALGPGGLYVANEEGILRIDLESWPSSYRMISDSAIQLIDCNGDTVYYMNARGELYLTFPTN